MAVIVLNQRYSYAMTAILSDTERPIANSALGCLPVLALAGCSYRPCGNLSSCDSAASVLGLSNPKTPNPTPPPTPTPAPAPDVTLTPPQARTQAPTLVSTRRGYIAGAKIHTGRQKGNKNAVIFTPYVSSAPVCILDGPQSSGPEGVQCSD